MKIISFFGSIGVGKTTAGTNIEKLYKNVQFIPEDLSENPFLPSFYDDMKEWGFHSSIAMLSLMSSYYQKIDKTKDIVIMDNGVEELIAYTMLECDMGVLSKDEYAIYKKLYDNIINLMPKTDLYVYIICDEEEALRRINSRGRKFEDDLEIDFLEKLNQKYRDYVSTIPQDKLLILDTTNNYSLDDFVEMISEKLNYKIAKK